MGENPATVRRIATTHAVGNHTQTHPHLPDLSATQMRAELDQAGTVNDRVLAPVCFLTEQLGAGVTWAGATWTVAIMR